MAIKKKKQNITADFTPVPDYDGTDVPPEAEEGEYTAVCKVKKGATKPEKGKWPMLTLTWKLTDAANPKNRKFKNALINDYLIFAGKNANGYRMFQQKLRQLCEHFGFNPAEVLPMKGVKTWADAEAIIEALEGFEGTVFVFKQKDKESGDERAQISYRAPKDAIESVGDDDEDADEGEEDEDEQPAAKKGAKGKAAPAKAAAKSKKAVVEEEEDEDEEEEDEEEEEGDEDEEEDEEDEDEDEPVAPPAKKGAVKKTTKK